MKIELIDPETLKSAAYNPRQISREELNKLIKSIKQFGFVDPALVRKDDNMIVGGHQRVKAALELGLKEIPVVFLDITENDAKLLNVALNKISGDWDEDKLTELLAELKFFDDVDELLTGFDEDELDNLIADLDSTAEASEYDDIIPEEVESVCKEGQLWKLGNHRLFCGDATIKKNYDILLNKNKIQMVFTDPPYGMNLETNYAKRGVETYWSKKPANKKDKEKILKRSNWKPVIGDDKPFDPAFIFDFFPKVSEMFLWGADYYAERIPDKNKGSWVVWDKRKGIEDVTFSLAEFELCWSKKRHAREIARVTWFGVMGLGKEDTRKRIHPTQKPVELVSWFFDKFEGDNVIDMFAGSGTTLIACEKHNRNCYAMELDPHYCDVIIKRWEDFTGQKAELLDGTL